MYNGVHLASMQIIKSLSSLEIKAFPGNFQFDFR